MSVLLQQKIRLTLFNAERKDGACSREFPELKTTRIGRASDNDIRLAHRTVSRSHATIVRTDEGWAIENLGQNGTFVDNKPVSRCPLKNGSVIRFAQSPETLVCEFPESISGDSPEDASNRQSDHKITCWLSAFRQGTENAASWLWRVYYEQIVELARERLGQADKRVADEEDVAQDAFKSVFVGLSGGRYPDVLNRHDFWGLLVVVTTRKAINQIKHDRRLKRGGGRVRDEAAMSELDPAACGIDQLMGDQPTPEFLAMMCEHAERLFAAIGDELLAKVVVWKLEGYTNEEIAKSLGCSVRTVGRKLRAIRKKWLQIED